MKALKPPYVVVATFAEIHQREDGVITGLPVLAGGISGPRVPVQGIDGGLLMLPSLYVSLATHGAKGAVSITAQHEPPSGDRLPPFTVTTESDGFQAVATFTWSEPWLFLSGIHVFDVIVGDRILTRVPLRVTIQQGMLYQ